MRAICGALLVSTFGLSACGDGDPLEPQDVAGSYAMVSIAGDSLPAPTGALEGDILMDSSALDLGSDGSMTITSVFRYRTNDRAEEPSVFTGTFEIHEDEVWLRVELQESIDVCVGSYSRGRIACTWRDSPGPDPAGEWVWERVR